ncbi:elongation factor G [Luteimicrobium xylanilyticum]|uniref:Elongation factor G-like protein n=1 Tax=Luteimicrobium xylanilyticum TaxID=1133546 RepID=A0A5P9Q8J4_9MICO|nr:elongation factor G [Luteimicrobium xylanilyticum]QFU96735.1 Elongation factor G-like protein [Luteimicrobium xylanilyticum]
MSSASTQTQETAAGGAPPGSFVRVVALVGHGGAGKTTLAEALLHVTGAIPRPGRVEDGSTVTDTEPEEIARGMSLTLGVAHTTWTGPDGAPRTLTLLDAPGHPDFAGQVDTALAVADVAAVVVSAADGVQAGTRAAWAAAREAGVPRVVVVTQEDKARADFQAVLADLRTSLGADGDELVPLELPVGEEAAFHGIADVLTEAGYAYDDDGHHHDEPLTDAVAAREHALHVEVTEDIVSHDDAQLEAYLGGDEPDAGELERTLAHEVAAGAAFPVLVASGLTRTGVDRVADLLWELAPPAAERDRTVLLGDEPVAVAADPGGEALAHVFRTVADPFVGQVSLFRVLSGTVRSGGRLTNASTGATERLHGLFRVQGKDHHPVDTVVAGEVGAVAKLVGTPSGTLLWARPAGATGARPVAPPARQPAYGLSLVPVSQSDDDRMSTALARLVAEDPTLLVERVAAPGGDATVLRGLGDTHLAVALERLDRVFGVHVTTGPVPVAYRETLARRAQAEGKVKKQSGGHGQFAVVDLRAEPLPRGAGFELVDKVVGGAIPRSYLPAVEKGLHDALAAGGPHGYPVVDVRVEVYDGKAHSVDSSEMAFRTAAAAGLREALADAGTVVLEPVSRVVVTVPSEVQGAVLTDLSGRRGHVAATEGPDDAGRVSVVASVPEAELARYVLDLRSLTAGQAELTIEPERYDVAPRH